MTLADQIHLSRWILSQVALLDNYPRATIARLFAHCPGSNVALWFGNMELESWSHGIVKHPFAWLELKVNYTVEACSLLI